MIYFLWLLFLLFIAEFCYILFFTKDKPITSKQTVVKSKDGKKTIIVLTNR